MTNESAYEILSEVVDEVFTASVESHLAFHPNNRGLTTRQFYEHLYVRRQDEDHEFQAFLRGRKTILILTGHMGVGKSTFIREKYQHGDSCMGITVDLKERQSARFLDGDFEAKLQDTIAHVVKDRLLANFRFRYNQQEEVWTDPMVDIAVRPPSSLPADQPDSHPIAELKLATYILCRDDFLKSKSLDDVRAKYGQDVPLKNLELKRQKYQERMQRLNVREAIAQVFEAAQYREWLRCYQLVFKQALPMLVVIDNSDVLSTKDVGGKVYQPLVDMESYLNHWDAAQIAGGFTLPNIKFVFAVRDQNITLINTFGHRPHACQISLGPEPIAASYIDTFTSLTSTDGFVTEILEKRLAYVEAKIDQMPDPTGVLKSNFTYLRRIFTWWFETNAVSGRTISRTRSQIDVVGLNNRSISQILEHISLASLQILKSAIWCKIPREEFGDDFAATGLRGRVIRSAWAMSNIGKLDQHWRQEFARKVNEPYISLTRLLLTRLVNHSREYRSEGMTPVELHKQLQGFFPAATLTDVKNAIFALHESTVGQGELVSIQQPDHIPDAPTIRDDSRITVMPRGTELLDKVIIQIDFFGELLRTMQEIPRRYGVTKILMEMTPNEAANYVCGIHTHLISKMAKHYKEAWCNSFCPCLRSQARPSQAFKPFEEFLRSKFVYKNTFYMQRCCSSHTASIKNYLALCLSERHSDLLLSEMERDSIKAELENLKTSWDAARLKEWQARTGQMATSPDELYLSRLLESGPAQNSLVRLWKVHTQYEAVLTTFRQVQSCDSGSCKLSCSLTTSS